MRESSITGNEAEAVAIDLDCTVSSRLINSATDDQFTVIYSEYLDYLFKTSSTVV